MKGYSRYEKLMANWAAQNLTPIHEAHKRGEQIPALDSFFEETFKGFTEISSTINALQLTQVFVSISPPRSRHIKKSMYLKYHVSVYLQEMYNLNERLRKYASKIQTAFSNSSRKNLADARIQPLSKIARNAMGGLLLKRNDHVHSIRYSDDDLDRISLFEIVSDAGRGLEEEELNLSYRHAKSTWKERIKKNNEETMKLLDFYFDQLYEVITISDEIHAP